MTDPDVRIVLIGLRRCEREIVDLIRRVNGAEQLGREARVAIDQIDLALRLLSRALQSSDR